MTSIQDFYASSHSPIRLSKEQKKGLAIIVKKSGVITAVMALRLARPKKRLIECLRYIRCSVYHGVPVTPHNKHYGRFAYSTQQAKETTATPWPCKFSDSSVCAVKNCSDQNCDVYEPA
jgi:hypothetical protein